MNRIMVLHGSCRRDPRSDREPLPLAAIAYAKRLELEARTPDARYASLAGLALAVAGLEALTGRAVAPGDIEFKLDGKPRIAQGPEFSIAHTQGWVGCAVAARGAVGFDLEAVTQRRSSESLERWTAVEAVLKATGAGLRQAREVHIDLTRNRGHLAGADFSLHAIALGAGLIAHVATDTADGTIDVREVRIEGTVAPFANDLRAGAPATEIA
jgi:phosphopantetheinyl transferase